MCNGRVWPQQRWKKLCKQVQHCCATLGDQGKKEMLVSNFAQQLPTTRNNKTTGLANGRNMQHPTMLGVVDQQCRTVCMGLMCEEDKRMQEGVT